MNDAAPLALTNPFPGLRPFRSDEEYLFFGRESQVDAMVDKLADTHFLAVVGTSGSGKSSLVNCGLRPSLRQGLMASAGAAWRMAQFRPGNDPIGAMASALGKDGVLFREDAAEGLPLAEIVETSLRMSKLGLIDVFEQARLEEGVNLLVVVDQFEELFRYRQLEAARGDQRINEAAAAFVNLLLEVKQQKTYPIFVVLTMRSDFLGDCTQFLGLAEAINAGQYLVPRLTRDERRAAIEGPVRVGGAEIAPVLLTRLVNDVGDNPDQLSILQHALNRTWARWREEDGEGPLDLTHYEAIGTMASALDRHAEQACAELGGARRQQICELLFKALTDKATDPRGVRRPTTLGNLRALTDSTEAEVIEVIDVFRDPSRSFLMPPVGEALQAKTVIDISHESLMRVWQRLNRWADEEAQSAQTYRRLAESAALHADGRASLWRDPELQLALNWRDNNHPNESWASRYHPGFTSAMKFLTQSSEAREAKSMERRQRRQRELEAAKEKAEAQVEYARRMRLWAISCGVLAVLAMICGVFAYHLDQEAERHRQEADQQRQEADRQRQEADQLQQEAVSSLAKVQMMQSRALFDKTNDFNDHNDLSENILNILLTLEALPDPKGNKHRPFLFAAHKLLSDSIDNLLSRTNPVGSVAVTPLPTTDVFDPTVRQRVVDQGKAVVPRCLTIEERESYLLAPEPPAWCIDMEKHPYNTDPWKAWKAKRMKDAVDPNIAQDFGNFSDTALKEGDFDIALEAANLGLQFDQDQFWILINKAEALMFLGRRAEATRDFLAHQGETLPRGPWDELILEDFKARRNEGRDEPLMKDIEQAFSPPAK